MNNQYYEYRKKIYRSIIGKTTAMKELSKSTFLRKNEADAAFEVVKAMENLKEQMQFVKHKDLDTIKSELPEFNVTANPFTKVVNIVTKIGKTRIHIQESIPNFDYWKTFKFGGNQYDFHFYYDKYFSVSAYLHEEGEQLYQKQSKVNLVVVTKELILKR